VSPRILASLLLSLALSPWLAAPAVAAKPPAVQKTAKVRLAAAVAEARKWQPDAFLVYVGTDTANPDGTAYSWMFSFGSPKTKDQVSVIVDDGGEVSRLPSFSANTKPLGEFIDSDAAMAAAVKAGMKTRTYGMKMSLKVADRAEWFMSDSDFGYTIDAGTGKLLSKE